MEVVWFILAAVIIVAVVLLIAFTSKRWIAIRSEGASRAHLIDRLEAYLKTQGVKAKVSSGAASTVQLKVLRSEEAKARALMETFDSEQ
ncbi:hypothetical protein PA598K_02923 [Paenibacillus sp. 598K]|uniref:hypothetical protein n=1 Tax=Paenibacillus sp. 598K TaxID=1117987 RepID=UPI000FFA634F|nr:hypothetical protein [Paenibacillus sp. 598K]GBF74569.1 hypothetical protein PA598K_02923 [Paenibacillus sp. 598K]